MINQSGSTRKGCLEDGNRQGTQFCDCYADEGIGSATSDLGLRYSRSTVLCSSTFKALDAESHMHVDIAIAKSSLTQGESSFVYSFGLSQPTPATGRFQAPSAV